MATWRDEEASGEQRCSGPLLAASPGLGRRIPDLVQNSLSEGDRAERRRKASRLSGAAAHPGPQCGRQVSGPWGDTCALMRKRILELGLALSGAQAAPSLFPSTSRFGEDFRAVLFSALPSIFIFQGSDSSRALGVEIRWRDQITARLCVRCVCGTEMARECAVSQQWRGFRKLGWVRVTCSRPQSPSSSPSPAEDDARPEWKRSFGGRGALSRKLTHHNSLPLSKALPTHLLPARDFLETGAPFRPLRE